MQYICSEYATDIAAIGFYHFVFLYSGTGKTYTGIKLLYLFNKINKTWHKEGNERKQVLFCGPSNKSVDLVASEYNACRFWCPFH